MGSILLRRAIVATGSEAALTIKLLFTSLYKLFEFKIPVGMWDGANGTDSPHQKALIV